MGPRGPSSGLRRFGRVIAATSLVVGCSPGFQPLNRPALRLTNPRSVAAPKFSTPRFIINMAGVGFAFGIIGAMVEQSIDNSKFPQRTGVRDPATSIRATLVAALAKRFALEPLDVDATAEAADADANVGAGQPARAPRSPDLVLEIRTSEWGLVRALQGGVGVNYQGTLRLLDARTKKVLAEAVCSVRPAKGGPVEELAEDHAAGLRAQVEDVAEFCTDDYRHRVLGLY